MRALKLFVTAAFCFALTPPAFAQQAIRIGVVQPLTGPVAYDGNIYVNTVKMIVDASTRRAACSAARSRSWSRTVPAIPRSR